MFFLIENILKIIYIFFYFEHLLLFLYYFNVIILKIKVRNTVSRSSKSATIAGKGGPAPVGPIHLSDNDFCFLTLKFAASDYITSLH